MLDVRADFPFLDANPGLAFLDSAASSQRPRVVIDAIARFDATTHANVHRGAYHLSQVATEAYEAARSTVAAFIGATDAAEVAFTRGTTSGLNLVAAGLTPRLGEGRSVVVTEMEHHANLIPWQVAARRAGAELRAVRMGDDHRLSRDSLDETIDATTVVVAVTGMSNVLGTRPDLDDVVARARAVGALVVVDGAQLVPHHPVDVATVGADALAFGAHKMLGPTGVGALWMRRDLGESIEPWETGGEMIRDVTLTDATWADLPQKFEAGTPPITQAIGFATALDYLTTLGMGAVAAHEDALTRLAFERLSGEVDGLTIHGPPPGPDRGGVISFTMDGVHPHDIATILDQHRVAVRAGHHCAKPLMRRLSVAATARVSFSVYSHPDDLDPLIAGLRSARTIFG
jgi:cysteine desulfurase / selenocysteine lyase